MATIDNPEDVTLGQYMEFIFGDTKVGLKEVDRHKAVSENGDYRGYAIEYEVTDKNGKVVNYVCLFVPVKKIPPHDPSAGDSTPGSDAAPQLGAISELYLMNPDDGKPPKLSQMGDPDLTIMAMKNLAIDPDAFVAGMSDDDSFNRYPYAVSLFNGRVNIEGSKFNDYHMEVGQGGKAVVDGNAGVDILHVWHQKTVDFDGGKGSDWLAFAQDFGRIDDLATIGATVDLRHGTGINPWGGTIKVTSVENLIGYYGAANTLTGDDGANKITGGGYGDMLKGMGGNDTITVWASFVSEGDGPRNLHADGGKGVDTLVFQSFFEAPNTLDLEHPEDNTGTFADSTFKNFEVFRGDGSMGTFTFRGSDADEKVLPNLGSSAADVLDGRGGDDLLDGGGGADSLTGGDGADDFRFSSQFDSTPAAPDTITDFSHAEHDRIDVSKFFDKLQFIGAKAFGGHADELHAVAQGSQTLVEADIDGDKTADFAVLLDGAPKLVESDFAL